ncbi:nucleoside diphosphate-linked moiety X motif 17 isoform X2 [Heliangelus exortis]|uniref:nucleoside diphosphate-linked moiety X motif 17 isoform X2 n=1 Tax=Heliangelus exortis TaxID=472823 RepID=UPI003A9309B6
MSPSPGATLTLLQRPPFCPAKHLEALQVTLPEHLRGHGVVAAVAVLLEATTGHVLLTRRASTLSTFPNVWVPPGGHLEPGEELLDVGLRELKEETGLHLPPGTFSWRTLGLWESVYPPMLSRGPPRRHHVVTYLLLQSSEPHQQLEGRMCPNQQEVSAYTWLDPQLLEAIAATQDGAERWEKVPSTLPPTVGITELSGGSSCPTRVPTSTFLSTVPAHGEDVERVSTGTKFALGRWVETRGGPQGHGVGGGEPLSLRRTRPNPEFRGSRSSEPPKKSCLKGLKAPKPPFEGVWNPKNFSESSEPQNLLFKRVQNPQTPLLRNLEPKNLLSKGVWNPKTILRVQNPKISFPRGSGAPKPF